MRRQGLLSATGVLLLGLVVLMTLHEWDTSLPGDQEKVLSAPAIIATDVSAKAFNEKDGSPQYHLTANTLTQYDHDTRTQLDKPVLEMANDQGSWTIVSEQGQVLDNNDLIVFSGQVSARNAAKKITLDSDELRFHSDANTVEAPDQAKLTFESGHTEAGSMSADLNTGVLTLDKGVKSEFQAPPGS
ncbi:hypothetical protein A11A3_10187 [Alcanivorax hongdengensis A-11-3]|uniref:Lipopolysaccharide export system protein LptC n=1 Tax=Alcanivorax hongdengensis A-11-3 TaxID=1177179 RepID=L0WEE2_9GAMM|nr:LPS export ABC transporter periplasmic protein LptC [Alcanivorax hongdengensis]EKF74180.1 hypothetical protein A11A3_10187 [Alcanivorax hongdengensis A-11-3]